MALYILFISMTNHIRGSICRFIEYKYSMNKDMNISVDDIVSCEYIRRIGISEVCVLMDLSLIKSKLLQMDSCERDYIGFISNGDYTLRLRMSDGSIRVISLSNDGKYMGYNTPKGSFSYWYYLINKNRRYTPFSEYIGKI